MVLPSHNLSIRILETYGNPDDLSYILHSFGLIDG